MTDDDRQAVKRLMEHHALDTLEVVVRCLDEHAIGQHSGPHRDAWLRLAQEMHTHWLALRCLPGGQ